MNADIEAAPAGVTVETSLRTYQAPVLVDLDVSETEAFNGGAGDAFTGS
jgi:hypothetical protein